MKMRKRSACVDYSRNTRSLDLDFDKPIEAALARGGGPGNGKSAPSGLGSTVLMVHGGLEDGADIPIFKPKVTMGSLSDNDIVVEGLGVSGRHAEILGRNDNHYLRDLGVVHPTYVNQRNIGYKEHLLQHGDRIQLASSTVTHVFTSGNRTLVKLTPDIPFEEQPGNTPRSAVSLHPASLFNHGTLNGQGPKELENHREALGQKGGLEIYEGTVRLTVEIEGHIRLVVSFVTELRLNSRLRMLRMVGNPPENVDIWLALREPMPLKQILDRMEEVAQVDGPRRIAAAQPGQVDILNVRLNTELGRNSLSHRFEKSNSP